MTEHSIVVPAYTSIQDTTDFLDEVSIVTVARDQLIPIAVLISKTYMNNPDWDYRELFLGMWLMPLIARRFPKVVQIIRNNQGEPDSPWGFTKGQYGDTLHVYHSIAEYLSNLPDDTSNLGISIAGDNHSLLLMCSYQGLYVEHWTMPSMRDITYYTTGAFDLSVLLIDGYVSLKEFKVLASIHRC